MRVQSKTPVFLVGCPRSGTTLLQSLLAAHPDIISFPESKFFQYFTPEYERRRKRLGFISQRLKPWLKHYFTDELGRSDLLTYFPVIPLQFLYVRQFIKVLSLLAEEQGKPLFLEKTPQHIFYIHTIEKYIPNAKIIHLLRSGTDVVASLYEVTHRYPQGWDGKWEIDRCVDHWKQAVKLSLNTKNKLNHHLVSYEQLTETPEIVLKKICHFLSIADDQNLIKNYSKAASPLLQPNHGRTVDTQKINPSQSEKFNRIFDGSQRQYIFDQVAEVNQQIQDLDH
ncbi:hypothetical protein L8106_07576 [Lyngbya sp. PCC 8106]|nr:hypothetical protein L8106_07576 [Lyngbya sp. PCC 8106]